MDTHTQRHTYTTHKMGRTVTTVGKTVISSDAERGRGWSVSRHQEESGARLARKVDFDCVIELFASGKARKVPLF